MLMHIKRLVRFWQFVFKVLSRNKILTSIKGQNSQKVAKNDRQQSQARSCQCWCAYKIWSINSQYIEWKLYSDVNQGLLQHQKFAKNDGQQSQARPCQCWCTYKIWSDSVYSFSRYWAETKFWRQSSVITLLKVCEKWQVTIPSKIMSMLMCIQNLVRFYQFVLEILSGNEILMSIKGRNSVKIMWKMTGNNPKLDLVIVNVHTKFGQILSQRFSRYWAETKFQRQSRAVTVKILQKMMGDNSKLDLVNVNMHTKFGQILSYGSQDIERKRNSDVNQGP